MAPQLRSPSARSVRVTVCTHAHAPVRPVKTRLTRVERGGEGPSCSDATALMLVGGVALALSAVACMASPGSAGAALEALSAQRPVYDGANILTAAKGNALSQRLREFETSTGWHLRVYTNLPMGRSPGEALLKQQWGVDSRTVVLTLDPSSPNALNVWYVGNDVQAKLSGAWWTELQGRYGNMFYVREKGEASALLAAVDAMTVCLGAEAGCRVVPGLPEEQLSLCIGFATVGGVVAGSALRLEPQGFVRRRWVWLLVFAPLWAPLFVNFGLGPVVSRTDDKAPAAQVSAGFAAALLAVAFLPELLRAPPPGGGGAAGARQQGDDDGGGGGS